MLEGRESIMQRVRATVRQSASNDHAAVSPLFEALKQWRKEKAAVEGVPPFMLFFDATLREIANVQPQTADQLLGVKGIGSAKAEKYGDGLLAIIHSFGGEGKATGSFTAAPKEASASSKRAAGDEQPSHLTTLALFQAGQEPDEIAKDRGLSRVTVEGHIIRCADEGEEIDWSRIIPAEYEQLIVQAIGELGNEKLRPIKDALPEEVTYFAIHGVMSKYGFKA